MTQAAAQGMPLPGCDHPRARRGINRSHHSRRGGAILPDFERGASRASRQGAASARRGIGSSAKSVTAKFGCACNLMGSSWLADANGQGRKRPASDPCRARGLVRQQKNLGSARRCCRLDGDDRCRHKRYSVCGIVRILIFKCSGQRAAAREVCLALAGSHRSHPGTSSAAARALDRRNLRLIWRLSHRLCRSYGENPASHFRP